MKRNIYLFTIFLMVGFAANAQIFWTETFGTSPTCATMVATSYSGPNGAWTTSLTGTNQSFSNLWYVSAEEASTGLGSCGDACSQNPIMIGRSLHISTSPSLLGDVGAAYSANSSFSNTDIRAQSPVINCTGQSNITMSYTYFVVGIVNQDYCELMYSSNGGLTWATLGIAPQTTLGACAPQGKWAAASVMLPAVCNNNNNVKIGFRWQNVSNTGADPCIAIDDITLATTGPASLAVTYTLPTSICRGDSTQATAVTTPSAASSYSWTSLPTGPIFSAPSSSVTWIKFPTTGTYSITITATSGTQIATQTKTILVNPNPTVNVVSNPSVICSGSSSTLNASSSTPGLSYSWTPVGGSQPSVVVSPTTNSTYQVWGTNTVTGCKGTAFITVTVNPLPNVSVSSSTMNICIGSSAVLTASGAATYSWMPSGSGSTIMVSPSSNTTYTVTGTSLGCSNSATITITTSTCGTGSGINVVSAGNVLFNIFPNPVNNKLTIRAGDKNFTNVKVEMYDVAGKRLTEHNIGNMIANSETAIDVTGLPKGVFIVVMVVDGKQQSPGKFIKE